MRSIDGEFVSMDLRNYLWCVDPPVSPDVMTSRGPGRMHNPAGWRLEQDPSCQTNLNPPVSFSCQASTNRTSARMQQQRHGPHQVGALVYDARPGMHAWALCAHYSSLQGCQLIYVGVNDGPATTAWRSSHVRPSADGLNWMGSSLEEMEASEASLIGRLVLPGSADIGNLCEQMLKVAERWSMVRSNLRGVGSWKEIQPDWTRACFTCPDLQTVVSLL